VETTKCPTVLRPSRNRRTAVLGLALVCLAVTAAIAPSAPAVPVERIVSIVPSATEMIYALGLGDRLVADTRNCDYPATARSKPHIGDMNVNVEAVVAMRPDLVVGDADLNARDIARLRQLNLSVLALHASTIGDVEGNLLLLGKATGAQPAARRVVARMQVDVKEARSIAARDTWHPKLLRVVEYDPLYVAGHNTFVGEIIETAGAKNAVSASGYPSYSREMAVAAMPDVILCSRDDAPRLEADPAWRIVPAVRHHRVYTIDSNLIDRPGPRLADGLLMIARIVRAAAG